MGGAPRGTARKHKPAYDLNRDLPVAQENSPKAVHRCHPRLRRQSASGHTPMMRVYTQSRVRLEIGSQHFRE